MNTSTDIGELATALAKAQGSFKPIPKNKPGKMPHLVGGKLSYVDLSLFQIVEGLRYAFPKRMTKFEREIPGLIDLHNRVAVRPNIKAYLDSDRRIAFNKDGIFRHYKALDK